MKLLALLLLCLPAWGAHTYITGFEMGSLGEFPVIGGFPSIQGTTVRTGAFALQVNPTATDGFVRVRSLAAGGAERNLFRSARMYMRIATMVDTDSIILAILDGANYKQRIILLSTGALRVSDGTVTATSTNLLTADNQWHLIEWDNGWNVGGVGMRVKVDSVEWASEATSTVPTSVFNTLQIGVGGIATFPTCNIYFDDTIASDSSAYLGAGQAILLRPISDNTDGAWVGGGGGTSLFPAVDNIPPVGVAEASDTDTSQINSASKSGTDAVIINTQSYTTGGIGASDTINAVMAICNDGEGINTGTKTGTVRIQANPSGQTGQSFDFGDNVGDIDTFPTRWRTHIGPVTASPSVTLGNSPTVEVVKTDTTTRTAHADFMGIYVDYTPGGPASTVRRRVTIVP